ncbi:unnamed protein product [Arabidopsis thaliana]|uniref:At5g42110 n=1 Tax=Arabidopsis thaliana TaxID=3702 RepID=Q9FHX4_ARATH|nr:At5g42110 [Arabidopsis thaliana]BAB08444.1 unnamed protein product [Arabidopsis thaliana]
MKVSSGVVASVIAVSTAALSSSSILPPVSPKVFLSFLRSAISTISIVLWFETEMWI